MFKNLYVASFISFSWTSAKEMQMFHLFVTPFCFFTVSVLCLIIEAGGGHKELIVPLLVSSRYTVRACANVLC